mgnify:FL=1
MESIGTLFFGGIGIVLLVLLLSWFVASRFVVIQSNEVGLVSGSAKTGDVTIILPGGRDFVWPIFQRIQFLPMTQQTVALSVTGEDANKINVSVGAVAAIKVGDNEAAIRAAAQRFLGVAQADAAIARAATEALEGTLRSIVGNMTVSDLISDRALLQQQVLEGAESALAVMGLVIDTLQVNRIEDDRGYIAALGQPEQERVLQEARGAKARNDRIANEAEATSKKAIAEANRDLEVAKAALKKEMDTAAAEAQAAAPLAKARKDREIAEEKRATAQAEAELRERELDTEVRKPADAARYQREQAAAATRTEQVAAAQAAAERVRLEAQAAAERVRLEAQAGSERVRLDAAARAEATALTARAEADAVEARGKAEAAATAAKGAAEAGATKAMAEAMELYGEAAKAKQALDILPDVVRAYAEPMSAIDGLTVVSTDGAGKVTQMGASVLPQVDALVKTFLGKSVSELVTGQAQDEAGSDVA